MISRISLPMERLQLAKVTQTKQETKGEAAGIKGNGDTPTLPPGLSQGVFILCPSKTAQPLPGYLTTPKPVLTARNKPNQGYQQLTRTAAATT